MASVARHPTARQRHQFGNPEKELQPIIIELEPKLIPD